MLNKHQQNDLSMRERVLKLLKDNLTKFPKMPEMPVAVNELDSLVSQIQSKSAEKGNATSGKTDAKIEAENELITNLLQVGGSIRGLASKEKDFPTKEKVSFRRSGLERMRDEELLIKASSVYYIASARAADLVSRGVTAEKLELLKSRTAAFKSALGAQGTSIPQRKGASKSIVELFKESARLLNDEIDGMMEHMQDEYPQFYAEYDSARQIRDLGMRHRPDEPPKNQGQAPPAT
ncbi:MAG: hypothetical protein B7Z63_02555 [Ignavibacteriae bacterium 37-53-5]|nr:MAG: hypothetical protein B7Z63_02555 [Ignavibacteriae bacterium 37-53-5]